MIENTDKIMSTEEQLLKKVAQVFQLGVSDACLYAKIKAHLNVIYTRL